jgi:hypothetical protein
MWARENSQVGSAEGNAPTGAGRQRMITFGGNHRQTRLLRFRRLVALTPHYKRSYRHPPQSE